MQTRRLGRTDLDVSLICLGTMTWGSQNIEAEGFEQMDYALTQGINFFDTAEMYAVPPSPEHTFRTETIIGNWFAARKNRDQVILATKIAGPAPHMHWVRDGKNRLDAANITAAVEGSLKRLQTDYIDLYQLHWPNRNAATFGQLGWQPAEEDLIPAAETLGTLKDLVDAGKIRHVGLSNESPWGVMQFLNAAEKQGLPRVVSIQNAYNLLNRSYEATLAEMSVREDVGLLAYAPLAAGTLSGKYLDGQMPKGSRRAFDLARKSRYDTPNAEAATRAYVDIARRHGLDPCQMAIAFVNRQPFVTSNIIGATSMAQLKVDIAAHDLVLSDEVLAEIEAAHALYTYPCP